MFEFGKKKVGKWLVGSDKLKVFVDYLNNLHPTIKFTCSHSLTNIPFLDVMVSLKAGVNPNRSEI